MLLLAIAQALHSLEEYFQSLWEVFEPARLASSMLSNDPETGFAVLNTLIVALAFWTYLVPVSRNWASARTFLWAWVALELGNGIGHAALALSVQGYFPGAYTAPLLLAASCYLGVKLLPSTTRANPDAIHQEAEGSD